MLHLFSRCCLSKAINTHRRFVPLKWFLNQFFTYTYYYSIPLRNKIFTHDVWSVNSLVFTMKNLLPCIAFTRQTDHRINLKFGWTFFAEQQLLKDNYGQTKESMILN